MCDADDLREQRTRGTEKYILKHLFRDTRDIEAQLRLEPPVLGGEQSACHTNLLHQLTHQLDGPGGRRLVLFWTIGALRVILCIRDGGLLIVAFLVLDRQFPLRKAFAPGSTLRPTSAESAGPQRM